MKQSYAESRGRRQDVENRPHGEGPLMLFIAGLLVGGAFMFMLFAILESVWRPLENLAR